MWRWTRRPVRQAVRRAGRLAVRLRRELLSGRHRHGGYTYFTIHEPKGAAGRRRDTSATAWCITRSFAWLSIFEKRFIEDSFACRRGRERTPRYGCAQFARRDRYALKCDVAKYFPRCGSVRCQRDGGASFSRCLRHRRRIVRCRTFRWSIHWQKARAKKLSANGLIGLRVRTESHGIPGRVYGVGMTTTTGKKTRTRRSYEGNSVGIIAAGAAVGRRARTVTIWGGASRSHHIRRAILF